MSPDLCLQKALLARFAATPDVTMLVPVSDMVDGQSLPSRFPSILIGEGQVVREPVTIAARHRRVYAVLHIWTKTLVQAREIAGAITATVEHVPLVMEGGHHAVSTVVSGARFLRDPDGEACHGIVTIDSLVEVAS